MLIPGAGTRGDRLPRWPWVMLDGGIWFLATYGATRIRLDFGDAPLSILPSVLVVALALARVFAWPSQIRSWRSRRAESHDEPALKANYPDLARSGTLLGDQSLLARKSVLMGMLTSGFVIANSDSTASSVKPTTPSTQPGRTPLFGPAPPFAPLDGVYLASSADDDTASVQAALNAATPDEMVRLFGNFTIAGTIYIKGNLDATGAVFTYTGSGVAVQIGAGGAGIKIERKIIVLPRIVKAGKPSTGWDAGTVGLRVVNANACIVTVPHVQGFEIGFLVYGQGQGSSYNTFNIGHLDNNKVNQKLDADGAGWSNQNLYQGGRFSHNSDEGTAVIGAAQIVIAAAKLSLPNNNTWINTSLEDNTAVYQIDCNGTSNMFVNCRFEAKVPRVRWGATSASNQLLFGLASNSLVQTRVAGATHNAVLTPNQWCVSGRGVSGTLVLDNSLGTTGPALVILAAGGIDDGSPPETAYTLQATSDLLKLKRTKDAHDRMQLDAQNGRVYVGDALSAPTRYFGAFASSSMGFSGGSVAFVEHNTFDVGLDANRPKYVRAGTALVTGAAVTASRPDASAVGVGAMFFDRTLRMPIWSDGTSWFDATGNVV